MKRIIALSMMLILITTIAPNKYVDKEVVVPTDGVQVECIVDEPTIYLDIPLSEELQEFTKNQCEYMGVPYEVVIAVMDVESGFQTDVISETNDHGIMQINVVNHSEIESVYGFTDLLDAKNNIVGGIYLFSKLYEKNNGDLHISLMEYNYGIGGAKKYITNGIYESSYSRKVVDKYNEYRNMERRS